MKGQASKMCNVCFKLRPQRHDQCSGVCKAYIAFEGCWSDEIQIPYHKEFDVEMVGQQVHLFLQERGIVNGHVPKMVPFGYRHGLVQIDVRIFHFEGSGMNCHGQEKVRMHHNIYRDYLDSQGLP